MVTINIQGIKGKNKQAELELFCQSEKPDIIFGTESHLDSDYLNNEVFPTQYKVFRRDRDKNGGGVFIAYKSDFIITEVEKTIENTTNECLIAKLETTKNPPLYLVVFYRPTDNKEGALVELGKQLNFITNKNQLPHLIVAGDFNVPSINWSNNSISK